MRVLPLFLYPLATSAINILLSNDDGWAEANIRSLYDVLTSSGHFVMVYAPASDKTGTGSNDYEPETLKSDCQFQSCPQSSPPTGHNETDPHLNYVNSYPVTSVRYGINAFIQKGFERGPDLVVTGPNLGINVADFTRESGTVGAAAYAAKIAGIPAIVFSGRRGFQEPVAWKAERPDYSESYANLAANVIDAVVKAGPPFLPPGVFLNVNLPKVGDARSYSCSPTSSFKYVLSRIYPVKKLVTTNDVEICGKKHPPWEAPVVEDNGCYCTVSVGNATTLEDSTKENQAAVLGKLGPFFSCFQGDISAWFPVEYGGKRLGYRFCKWSRLC